MTWQLGLYAWVAIVALVILFMGITKRKPPRP